MQIAVVILNYNTVQLLLELLPVVIERSSYANVQIVVADNASTDGSAEAVAARFPQIKLIQLKENGGYAGGYNKALAQVEADYFYLLNSDAVPGEHWLEPLLEMVQLHPALGAIQPHIYDYKQPQKFEYAGAGGGYIDHFGYPFCRGRIFGSVEKDEGQYQTPERIFWASGAALFISKRAFSEAGGFDESFFAHMEEIDLCWRMQNLGYDLWSCPSSKAYHIGGGTLSNQSPRKTYLNFRNGLLLLHKNLPIEQRERTIFKRKLLDGLAACFFLLQGKWKHIPAIVKAHKDFDTMKLNYFSDSGLNKPWNQLQGVFQGSLVYHYFLKGGKFFSKLNRRLFTK